MKILTKTLDVLEFVINSKGQPVTPSVISNAVDINPASCVRILADLVARGYLIRVSRNSGYIPGPAVFTFKDRIQWNYARLAEAAREPVDELSLKLGITANIAVINKGAKYMLYHSTKVGERILILETRYTSELYMTATGRLLFGECSVKELAEIFEKEQKKICTEWDGVKDLSTFLKAVNDVSKAGEVCYIDRGGVNIIGALVHLPDLNAAIGFGCAPALQRKALELLRKTVHQVYLNYTNTHILL